MIALAAATLAGCGSPRTTVVENASLENAIACYIDGDLDRAESLLLEFTKQPHEDEDCQTAYLYLGRIYLARGDYVRAADALSTGRALGGDVRFDEYFDEAQRHLTASPSRISQYEKITRGHLASLIGEMFGTALRESVVRAAAGTIANDSVIGQAEKPGTGNVEGVWRSGVMRALPDGELHTEEVVTRGAFYVIVLRLVETLGGSHELLSGIFAGGYRSAVIPRDATVVNDGEGGFIPGTEVIRALEAVAQALGLQEGG